MLCNILAHLRSNINAGLESLEDARGFVKLMDGLTDDERLLLEVALLDTESTEAFHAFLAARDATEGRNESFHRTDKEDTENARLIAATRLRGRSHFGAAKARQEAEAGPPAVGQGREAGRHEREEDR